MEKEINHIITAITQGFMSEALNIKLRELEENKNSVVDQINDITKSKDRGSITREQVEEIISACGHFVRTRNIPECKKFISFYIKKVLVFKDHIEIIMKFDPHTEDMNGGEREIRTLGTD